MAEYKSEEPCVCCGLNSPDMVCYHHIYTRKAYPQMAGKDWNKIPVCLIHHNEFHTKGTYFMADKYYKVKLWLSEKGWYQDSFFKKWLHDLK